MTHSPEHDHGGHDHGAPRSGGHGHSHSHANGANSRAVGIAALLTGGFMGIEAFGGYVSGSLALLADAGHMATDFVALSMAWLAFRVARRPADAKRTYGFARLSVLAAFVNGLALFLVAIWIVFEAIHRLGAPEPVRGGLMFLIATCGLFINLLTFWILSRGDRENLNMRGAILHVLSDLLGSLAAMIAALVILWTGWLPIDPILSVLVAVLVLHAAWGVVRDSAHILLEGSPDNFDAAALAADLRANIPGLIAARHLHAWSITEERPMVTLEALIAPGTDPEAARRAIKARLTEAHGFTHSTVEIQINSDAAPSPRLPDAAAHSI